MSVPGEPRWGIAGYGWVARDYMAPGIRAAGGKVAAVADPSRQAQEAARAQGAAAYPDLPSMLAAERLDALYVATPNHLHADAVEQAVRAGVPTLCEKPLAHDAPGLDRIAAAAASARAPLATAFDQRHHPAHAAVRDAVAAGALGTVTAVRIVYCCWVDPDWSRGTGDNWRADQACAGGGAVLDLAPHGLDLAHHLLGEPVEELGMVLQRRVHDYGVEDGGMVTGRTRSGVLFSSHCSYNWPEALPRRRLEIAGTGGVLVASNTMGQDAGGHMTLIRAKGGGHEDVPFDTQTSPFTRQAAAFGAMLRGEPHPFDITRDIAAARAFFTAYGKARQCL